MTTGFVVVPPVPGKGFIVTHGLGAGVGEFVGLDPGEGEVVGVGVAGPPEPGPVARLNSCDIAAQLLVAIRLATSICSPPQFKYIRGRIIVPTKRPTFKVKKFFTLTLWCERVANTSIFN